ncbi:MULTISPECIES: amino acid permease [Parachlamydia]|jgi:tyrosine-specific transport protein|nr:aromatic amino acid transport family protein [Parachlamydia acanthamoebae]EFB42840.1 hypothetical protein pah_c001o025 [Parachlamydia acanthamoebae str. Hall's coccus]
MMSSFAKEGSATGGVLLVAGCCIGAGMLGLPVVSALTGFIPASLILIASCFVMICTGLLVLELTLSFDHEVSLISMAKATLGQTGKFLTWILFILLFYCILVAYASGSGEIVANGFHKLNIPISHSFGSLFSMSLVACLIYLGTHAIDRLNRILMIGLVAAYGILILLGMPNIEMQSLHEKEWSTAFATVPLMLISFGHHNLIPSLTIYMKRNVSKLRLAIILGNLIPLGIYLLWEGVILGMLPLRNHPLFSETVQNQDMASGLLTHATGSPYILTAVNLFAFLAIATSLITTALSCIDFLSDGLSVKNEGKTRAYLCAAVLLSPLPFAVTYPHIFLTALGYAGGFITVILFGVLPALMAWRSRYHLKQTSPFVVRGGKTSLAIIMTIFFAIFILEIFRQFSMLM